MEQLLQATMIIQVAIATYGLAVLISDYDGPFDILYSLRGRYYRLFSCHVCLSFWIAIPISIMTEIGLIGYLTALGLVILLERIT